MFQWGTGGPVRNNRVNIWYLESDNYYAKKKSRGGKQGVLRQERGSFYKIGREALTGQT